MKPLRLGLIILSIIEKLSYFRGKFVHWLYTEVSFIRGSTVRTKAKITCSFLYLSQI